MIETTHRGQLYRATLITAVGTFIFTDVDAETGDMAAERALAQHPGAKVTHIEPAPAALQPNIIAQKQADERQKLTLDDVAPRSASKAA